MTDENEVMVFISKDVRHQLKIVKAVEDKENYNQTVKMLIDIYKRNRDIERLTGDTQRQKEKEN